MKALFSFLMMAIVFANSAVAGDDASGSIPCSVDLSGRFETYEMTHKDNNWSRSLVRNLKYKGEVVHFVKTSLPFTMKGSTVSGSVYQALEKPEYL